MTERHPDSVVPFPGEQVTPASTDELIVFLYRVATGDITLEQWLGMLCRVTQITSAALESLNTDGSPETKVCFPEENNLPGVSHTTAFGLNVIQGKQQHQLVVADSIPAEARATITALLPHLSRVLSLQETLKHQRARITNVAKSLAERMVVGVIVFQTTTRLIAHSNAIAKRLCASSGRLKLDNELLAFNDPHLEVELDRLLTNKADDPTHGQLRLSGSDLLLACDRLERQAPVDDPTYLMDFAVLYVFHTKDLPKLQTQALQQNFGLTPREARVTAGICSGWSLEKLAAEHHVSYHTLRVQLKSAMSKCGVHSQVALVKKVLKDPRLLFFGAEHSERRI